MLKKITGSGIAADTAGKAVGFTIPGRILSAIVLWVCAPIVLYAATPEESVPLRTQPRICVTAVGDQACSMQMLVTWTATSAMNVCLKFPEQTEVLHCWQEQQEGEFSMSVSREGNVNIQLLDAQTDEVLSEAEIPVIKRDLRDTRRRRRHAWSVF